MRQWLARAKTYGVPALQTFATGVQQDLASIEAALTTGWSNGQTEGHVNQLKLLKRQMYGRARFELVADSREVATALAIQHENLLGNLEAHRATLEAEFGRVRFETGTLQTAGGPQQTRFACLTEN